MNAIEYANCNKASSPIAFWLLSLKLNAFVVLTLRKATATQNRGWAVQTYFEMTQY